jgi:DNA-binding transcriptional MerR regulator
MSPSPLRTMKQVADLVGRPAHRIIHLCETGVVCPTVDAAGRGSVRRFNREDVFRVALALHLQDAGIQVPLIKPLMAKLDDFMAIREIRDMRKRIEDLDLVQVVRLVGTDQEPVLAWLTPPDRIALVTPKIIPSSSPDIRVDLHANTSQVLWRGVSIVVNLTMVAVGL